MEKFLVTGGAGFIGSHLADALLAAGQGVRVLDDLSTGRRANLDPRCELLVGDVADPAVLRAALAGVAGCFHLAAIASVARGNADWRGTHRINQSASVAVFEAAREAGRLPVVYASSAAVYGDPGGDVATEDAPCAPLTAYGADKLGSELHAAVAWRVHGVPTLGLRFFNVYGPRQDPSSPYSGVISIFARRAEQGLPISVFGDGEQTRDFIYVGDLVKLLVKALLAEEVAESAINVGLDQSTSLNQLLAEIGKLTGGLPQITYQPARHGDIRHSRADNRRLLQRYHLDAPTPLAEGLAQLITTRVC